MKMRLDIQGIAFMVGCLLLGACSDQVDTPRIQASEGETTVSFNVKAAEVESKATVATEKTVNQLLILVFEEDSQTGNYLYAYTVTANSLGNNTFDATLHSTDSKVKTYLLGNVTDISAINTGDVYEDVVSLITVSFTPDGPTYIPMYGEAAFNQLASGGSINTTVYMLRALATVEVSVESEVTSKFKLKNIQAVRANSLIQVIPDAYTTNTAGNKVVTTPSVPAGSSALTTSAVTNDTDDTTLAGLYIPESEAITDESIQTSQATSLIVGGIYLGEDASNTEVTYYRVDFKTSTGSNFGQVLRNHKYMVSISEVSGPGESSVEEAGSKAGENMGTNLIILDNDDSGSIYGPDGSFLSVETSNIYVNYYEGATQSISVDSDPVPYTIQWLDDSNNVVAGKATITWGGTAVEGTYFSLAIAADGSSITATALDNNLSGTERREKALITLNSIQLVITIIQKTQSTYDKDNIVIFSYCDLGADLGDEIMSIATFPTVMTPFRDLIKNTSLFGPGGKLAFGGFTIAGLYSSASPMTTRLADLFDIILLQEGTAWVNPNNTYPSYEDYSIEMFTNLTEWLRFSPQRVLMTVFDNEHMATPLGLNNVFSWGSPSYASGNQYAIADNIPSYLRKGPFGELSTGSTINSAGINYYISQSDNPHLTPILVMSGNPDQMVMSIDEDKRIVYFANTTWLKDYGLLTGSGTISNTFDMLIGNLVSWMADTVVGDKLAPDT